MAEGFETYHVPQQSRRDKLRINQPAGAEGCVDNNLLGRALYDPSLISHDLINCANVHRQTFNLHTNTSAAVKDEGMNLMGFLGGINMINQAAGSSSTSTNHMYVDPQLSAQLNPSTVQDINGNPYVYSFHGNDAVAYKPDQTATNAQSLSLSLSSHHQTHRSNVPLELNLQRYDSSIFSNNTPVQLSRGSVPLGPFTGYASVLKGSRFLKPAHQLLEEICDVGRGIFEDKITDECSLLGAPALESLSGNGGEDVELMNCSDGGEQNRKKSRLISMLDEVYKRYKQYYQQMQSVFASFESVAGLRSAAPFANMAVKAMAKHFTCLKNAITDQLQFTTNKSHGRTFYEIDETQKSENSGRGNYVQRPFGSSKFVDQPVWRPQRGLPERAVTVLRAWLFEHFLHPYPTDTDKLMLAKQTGLSRNQVSNWFINARVRIWKPMVEEIHTLETRQSQKSSQRDEQISNRINGHLPTTCSVEYENPPSINKIGEFSLKRTRNDLTDRIHERPMNFPYNEKMSNHSQVGVGASNGGGVSLTLGLHQNNVGLSESYPINAARRFGLDSHGEGYGMGGFATQNRQFGRDDIIEAQLLHDFQETDH